MHAEPVALPEEEEQAVTPGDDSNDDPTPPLPADPTGSPSRNPAVDSAPTSQPGEPVKKEEPEIGNERDIPSDGRDMEGEGMIREVGRPNPPSDKPKGA